MRGLEPVLIRHGRACPGHPRLANFQYGVDLHSYEQARVHQHRVGEVAGFSKRYRLIRLVYYEEHETVLLAIQREKNMKRWPRAWKARLINEKNREWRDLYGDLF